MQSQLGESLLLPRVPLSVDPQLLRCNPCVTVARYRMSKAALNAAGVSLAHDLKGDGMSVAILHPGTPRTIRTLGLLYTRLTIDAVLHVAISGLSRAGAAEDGLLPPRNIFPVWLTRRSYVPLCTMAKSHTYFTFC